RDGRSQRGKPAGVEAEASAIHYDHQIPAMNDNVLIPLPGFELPGDFPWRIGFAALVDEQLRRLRVTGHFLPPRFFGYYFQAHTPVAVSGSWTVSLDIARPVSLLPELLERITRGEYSITTLKAGGDPD